jgi:hypothetical protein
MSIFFLFHWILLLSSLNSISYGFFSKTLEQYWNNHGVRLLVETLTFGDDVIQLFARFVIYGYPFVTPLAFRVIVYPFNFGLDMCWGCIRVELGSILDFLEVGNRSQLDVIYGVVLEARLGWIWEKF